MHHGMVNMMIAPFGFQLFHDFFDVLRLIAAADQDGVLGCHNHEILDTRHRHQRTFAADIAIVGFFHDDVTKNGVTIAAALPEILHSDCHDPTSLQPYLKRGRMAALDVCSMMA